MQLIRRTDHGPAVIAFSGLALLAITWIWANDGAVPAFEIDVFGWFNDSIPDGLEWLLWLPMQFGSVGAIPIVVGVVYFFTRRWQPALVAALIGIEGWALAKVIKPIVERGRPGVEIDDVIQRGGSIGGGHDEGFGFVSGHAAVAFGMAVPLAFVLPGRWKWLPLTVAAVAGIGRIYFGAHLPLDVVGGAGLGFALAGLTIVVARRISAASI